MKEVNPQQTIAPRKIREWLWDTLAEISDEIGIEENGRYMLAYEGWSGDCVSHLFDPKKSEEENEDEYYKYAEAKSNNIIKEWLQEYKETHHLIDYGYKPIGLYGVTWALFKKSLY